MHCQEDGEEEKGSLWLCLPFFLVMIDSWWPEPNLNTYSSRMRFFSLVPEMDEDLSDIGVGKTAAHEWLFAGS